MNKKRTIPIREELLPFALALKEFRAINNIPAVEMAEYLGVSTVTLSHIETGRREPSITVLDKLRAKGMDVSVAFSTLKADEINLAYRVSEIEARLKILEKKLTDALKILN